MAKLAFSKLGLNKIKEPQDKQITFNGQTIEIKQYLSIEEKIEMISAIVAQANAGIIFKNNIALDLFTNIELIKYYTNISFTENQLKNIQKTYDLMEYTGLLNKIIMEIPEEEYNYIVTAVDEASTAIVNYSNSARGILSDIIEAGENLNVDVKKIEDILTNPENLNTIKTILNKLN